MNYIRYGMVWYGMVWYGMVWYGMVWYGMVWYGMVWYGMMVWYGTVRYGYGQNTRHLRKGVSITQILFNIPYDHARSARLASFHCNGRPRARAPIIVTIITTNVHANTKNSSLYVRKVHNTRKPYQRKTKQS